MGIVRQALGILAPFSYPTAVLIVTLFIPSRSYSPLFFSPDRGVLTFPHLTSPGFDTYPYPPSMPQRPMTGC